MSKLHKAVTATNGPMDLKFSCKDLSCVYFSFCSNQGHKASVEAMDSPLQQKLKQMYKISL